MGHELKSQDQSIQASASGRAAEMLELMGDLYPICRSITGDGVRQTLSRLGQLIPLVTHEVPTGTPVFDWTIPREWNIRDAWVKNARGERVIDFRKCNLHVLNYSVPVHQTVPLAELKAHLFTLPEHPDWIPYRTSYYAERWGFCMSHREMMNLTEGEYEVRIDSTLAEGALSYGECYVPGETEDEILISSHVCHPSLANDNLAGIAVATYAARALEKWQKRRFSYRFLFVPGTIGSITWLARNEERVGRIKHGLILTCLGDAGACTYKKSRRGDAEIDRVVGHVLRHSNPTGSTVEFKPYGYDERQYCSPGFNLPVGCLMRTPNGRYPEYHTSADNLGLISPAALDDSLQKLLSIFSILEHNQKYQNTNPKCEPQLGRRGLYATLGGQMGDKSLEMAFLWVLNFSDSSHSLLEIAERAEMPFATIQRAAELLEQHQLLVKVA